MDTGLAERKRWTNEVPARNILVMIDLSLSFGMLPDLPEPGYPP